MLLHHEKYAICRMGNATQNDGVAVVVDESEVTQCDSCTVWKGEKLLALFSHHVTCNANSVCHAFVTFLLYRKKHRAVFGRMKHLFQIKKPDRQEIDRISITEQLLQGLSDEFDSIGSTEIKYPQLGTLNQSMLSTVSLNL